MIFSERRSYTTLPFYIIILQNYTCRYDAADRLTFEKIGLPCIQTNQKGSAIGGAFSFCTDPFLQL